MSTSSAPPFGQRVYEAIRGLGRLNILTAKLDYEEIQRLKEADREETCRLLGEAPLAMLDFFESSTPGEVAAYVKGFQDARESQFRDDVLWWILFF